MKHQLRTSDNDAAFSWDAGRDEPFGLAGGIGNSRLPRVGSGFRMTMAGMCSYFVQELFEPVSILFTVFVCWDN